jgi:hypothetical protein
MGRTLIVSGGISQGQVSLRKCYNQKLNDPIEAVARDACMHKCKQNIPTGIPQILLISSEGKIYEK